MNFLKQKQSLPINQKKLGVKVGVWLLFFLFGLLQSNAQEVKASIDSTAIKIGEKITYKIKVDASPSDMVIFPEGQTFSPLEVIDTTKIDTVKANKRYRLIREYALTQFDTGKYTIPRQKILINEKQFFTDSIPVEVNNVVVDTTKQKLFPIKPSVEVEPATDFPWWILWIVLGGVAVAVLVIFILKQKRKLEEAKQKLPPYEQAMVTLKTLDESDVLEKGEMKAYYSTLTEAVKRYLDEQIDERALESTTDELIERLKTLKNSQKLYLKEHVLQSLEAILKRADLAKFAGISMDRITAKNDRKTIEEDINEFKKSIPEPTEEELLKNEQYRLEQERKRKKRRLIIGIAAGIGAVILAIAVFVGVKGITYVKDLAFASPSQELLDGDWITSEYGDPGVTITTPKVLVRENLPLAKNQPISSLSGFGYGKPSENLFVYLLTAKYGKQGSFDLEKSMDVVLDELEKYGGQNITNKKEEYSTPNGVEGVKVFGTFTMVNPVTKNKVKKKYSVLNFAAQGGFQQIVVVYNHDDSDAEEIASRINNSVEFNANNN